MRARLILVVPTFPKLSETFIVSKAFGLLEAGWDVHIACGRRRAVGFHHHPANGAPASRSPMRRRNRPGRIGSHDSS